MKEATLLFLLRHNEKTQKDEILLALKKRGFGVGKWNGAGGKFDATQDETIDDTAIRETYEEIGVSVNQLVKVAINTYEYPHNPNLNLCVHAYFCKQWQHEPKESEEMRPQWYETDAIPYDEMWCDDLLWLPRVLAGEKIVGTYIFDETDQVVQHDLRPMTEKDIAQVS